MAGVVTAVGARVSRFRVGDEVYARPADFRIGTLAEFITVPEADVAPKPCALTMTEAASLPLVALTAWPALVEVARLRVALADEGIRGIAERIISLNILMLTLL